MIIATMISSTEMTWAFKRESVVNARKNKGLMNTIRNGKYHFKK